MRLFFAVTLLVLLAAPTAAAPAESYFPLPVGAFMAWKLQSVSKRGAVTATVHTWYAPGVGIVKVVREENGERDREGSSELVSYRIP